jgi:hypothetical protein
MNLFSGIELMNQYYYTTSAYILLLFINLLNKMPWLVMAKQHECSEDADCERIWPRAICSRRGRCQCPVNQVRRSSKSRGWVCLALLDAG